MEEKITKLVGLWYRTLVDHHKDRDCHWTIQKTWSYGREPRYRVYHPGYILGEIDEEFPNNAEATMFLADKLTESIHAEIEQWKNAEPDMYFTASEIDTNRAIMQKIEQELEGTESL